MLLEQEFLVEVFQEVLSGIFPKVRYANLSGVFLGILQKFFLGTLLELHLGMLQNFLKKSPQKKFSEKFVTELLYEF